MKIFLSILKTPINIPNSQLWEMNVSVENIVKLLVHRKLRGF